MGSLALAYHRTASAGSRATPSPDQYATAMLYCEVAFPTAAALRYRAKAATFLPSESRVAAWWCLKMKNGR